MKKTVTVILTCHNRREMTINCIQKLQDDCRQQKPSFIIVDDGSKDGTREKLEALQKEGYSIHIISGSGNLYWCGGMRKGIEYAKKNCRSDYYLLVNDDVDFFEGSLEGMIEQQKGEEVLVGAVCDKEGRLSYGGICYTGKGIKYYTKGPEYRGNCDTFNANCVLLPKKVFLETPNIDSSYVHTLGDFDYGLRMSRGGIPIRMYHEFAGECTNNSVSGTWRDRSLSVWQRIKRKESPKGAPLRQWLYFLKKNFGTVHAIIHGFTPYLRILLGR